MNLGPGENNFVGSHRRIGAAGSGCPPIPRDTPIKKAIYACDELVGFIGACVKVRPSKSIHDLPVESVVKKFKDKAFARSVDRGYIYGGASAIGRTIEEHTAFVIEALKPVAEEIGLQGTPPVA